MSEWTEERIEALRETLKATGCGLGAGIAIDVLDALDEARRDNGRLKTAIGVCDKCGQLLTPMDNVCWSCFEKWNAKKDAAAKEGAR